MKLWMTVLDGSVRPRFMGFARWNYATRTALLVLMPFNLVVGWRDRLRDGFVAGLMPSRHARALEEAFQRGRASREG